jgi:hypothetical protein
MIKAEGKKSIKIYNWIMPIKTHSKSITAIGSGSYHK